MATKQELFRSVLGRYLNADKKTKCNILDELEANTKMHRKAVIRALKTEQMRDPLRPPKKRGRKIQYDPMVTSALKTIWEVSRELCAERLKFAVADYISPLIRDGDWQYSKDTTTLLLKMSMGTMKSRIATFQKARHSKGISSTKPSHLKEVIPVRRGPWENPNPGDGEVDTVAHCGGTLKGDFAYTVNFVSIATGWTESVAQLNKGQQITVQSLQVIQHRLPWMLTGLDPDSGSEFINWHCKTWCDAETIELTRSRPNHKNDNAYIEQKNYTAVRKLLGYSRIETQEAIALMNKLYAGPWRLYINFFQPTMKCIEKKRIGSKYIRKYDEPKTPYQRALDHPDISQDVKDELKKTKETLNPLQLKKEIDMLVSKIFKISRFR